MIAGYFAWAGILFAQNFSFTYVSRARNSGSVARHAKAAVFSNGIWIFSQIIMLGPMLSYLQGKAGLNIQILTGLVYTVATVAGSIVSHYVTQHFEKGKNAVGANKLYAQVPVAEWARVQELLKAIPATFAQDFERVKNLAEQAHDASFDKMPAPVSARMVDGQVVTSGL